MNVRTLSVMWDNGQSELRCTKYEYMVKASFCVEACPRQITRTEYNVAHLLLEVGDGARALLLGGELDVLLVELELVGALELLGELALLALVPRGELGALLGELRAVARLQLRLHLPQLLLLLARPRALLRQPPLALRLQTRALLLLALRQLHSGQWRRSDAIVMTSENEDDSHKQGYS